MSAAVGVRTIRDRSYANQITASHIDICRHIRQGDVKGFNTFFNIVVIDIDCNRRRCKTSRDAACDTSADRHIITTGSCNYITASPHQMSPVLSLRDSNVTVKRHRPSTSFTETSLMLIVGRIIIALDGRDTCGLRTNAAADIDCFKLTGILHTLNACNESVIIKVNILVSRDGEGRTT